MKFYSELQCNESVLIGDDIITFDSGVYETEKEKEIETLQKFYKFDGVAISEKETTTAELTKAQIVEQLKANGVEFDARQNKETLLELLKVGE